jgi:predicted alpha-1,2-mannosidase
MLALIPLLFELRTAASPSDLVNPLIGATAGSSGYLGKTFPGAATPFGMVQLSPDTITGGDNGAGYGYEHHSIEGFSFTHMSGVGWYGDLGNLLVMPTTGPLVTNSGREAEGIEGYRSPFSHATEVAKPGYYAATLDKYQVRVEAAAAPRAGILRFTFPKGESRIQIDLARRIGGTSTEQNVRVVDDHTIEGWMRCTPEGGGWGDGAGKPNYTVYFVGRFSKPLKQYGVWSCQPPTGRHLGLGWAESREFQYWARAAERLPMARAATGGHLGFYAEFPTQKNEPVLFKAGISFSSLKGAKANLNADIPNWDFEAVRRRTNHLWNEALGKVEIEGGTKDERTIFETALYHTMIDPRDATDVTGEHPSGDGKSRVDRGFTYRTIFSGWDVFRSEHPLLTLIAPKVVNDQINSLVQLADLSGQGYLERWEFFNAYSGCMVGNPAIPVIADAYQKGIRDFPVAHAYELAVATNQRFGNPEAGYVPGDLSQTLEYSYDEWCAGQLAGWLGKPEDAAKFGERAQAYRRVFDPNIGWFRARRADGSWEPWPAKGPTEWVWCVESNPLQQGWFVPQDTDGLASLLGGKKRAATQLEDFFEKTPKGMGWNDHYNHSNEPVHHVPFLFNVWGKPWLTQKWVHEILTQAYRNDVEGLCGNDDVGQMSAWYVLAAMGFHPLCPGNGRYEICGPLFDKVTLRLDPKYAKGQTFTIRAKRSHPGDIYIQSATLSGKPFNRSWIGHDEIVRGGTLSMNLGPKPNLVWGVR